MSVTRRLRRQERLQQFDFFYRNAKDMFEEIAKDDLRHAFFQQTYSFYVAPGGVVAGLDQRMVEVIYGKRAVERLSERGPEEGSPFGRTQTRHVIEVGASLFYERMESGIVFCGLRPAKSEGYSRREDFIILGWIHNPGVLTGFGTFGTLARHWQAFISYMEFTSLDGEPTLSDRVRVWWLLFTCPLVIEGKYQRPHYLTVAGWTFVVCRHRGLERVRAGDRQALVRRIKVQERLAQALYSFAVHPSAIFSPIA